MNIDTSVIKSAEFSELDDPTIIVKVKRYSGLLSGCIAVDKTKLLHQSVVSNSRTKSGRNSGQMLVSFDAAQDNRTISCRI